MSQPKIITIGGGTGSPIIIRSLIKAGFSNISAVTASMDSGGKTGIIRSDERDQVIAVSDLLRNLLSLLPNHHHQPQSTALTDLFSYTDGRNRNLGYTIYYGLLEKYQNDFEKVQHHLETLLNLKFLGTAIPITCHSTNIFFQTKSGTIFSGEHEFDRQALSKDPVKTVWIKPLVPASPQAIKAIETADYLIYSPGSLYGSVLANFLPNGIKEALKASKAHKILITNLTSNRNQTHLFTPQKYLHVFQQYTDLKKPFNTIIIPPLSRTEFESKYPEITHRYALQHSHFLGWTPSQINKLPPSIRIINQNIFYLTPSLSRLRHDPKKLSRIFKKLIK